MCFMPPARCRASPHVRGCRVRVAACWCAGSRRPAEVVCTPIIKSPRGHHRLTALAVWLSLGGRFHPLEVVLSASNRRFRWRGLRAGWSRYGAATASTRSVRPQRGGAVGIQAFPYLRDAFSTPATSTAVHDSSSREAGRHHRGTQGLAAPHSSIFLENVIGMRPAWPGRVPNVGPHPLRRFWPPPATDFEGIFCRWAGHVTGSPSLRPAVYEYDGAARSRWRPSLISGTRLPLPRPARLCTTAAFERRGGTTAARRGWLHHTARIFLRTSSACGPRCLAEFRVSAPTPGGGSGHLQPQILRASIAGGLVTLRRRQVALRRKVPAAFAEDPYSVPRARRAMRLAGRRWQLRWLSCCLGSWLEAPDPPSRQGARLRRSGSLSSLRAKPAAGPQGFSVVIATVRMRGRAGCCRVRAISRVHFADRVVTLPWRQLHRRVFLWKGVARMALHVPGREQLIYLCEHRGSSAPRGCLEGGGAMVPACAGGRSLGRTAFAGTELGGAEVVAAAMRSGVRGLVERRPGRCRDQAAASW